MKEKEAHQVIRILDKILAKNESIIKVCDRSMKIAEHGRDPSKHLYHASRLVIMHYSNLSAAGGGLSSLPGLIPGIGLVYSLLGSSAISAILAFKFELEMSLALAHLTGIDISDPRERKLAFLMVCSALEEAYSNDEEATFVNVLDIAMSEYSTRELSKTLIKAVARVLVMFSAKKMTKFFPLIGTGIETVVDKVLCERLGRECWRAYSHRMKVANENGAKATADETEREKKEQETKEEE
ncbi:MAG: hypothetical protein IJU23_12925 [Proteobacteria bacterium]|nr:hypothetical protein [Pseudomonadota bacterium]